MTVIIGKLIVLNLLVCVFIFNLYIFSVTFQGAVNTMNAGAATASAVGAAESLADAAALKPLPTQSPFTMSAVSRAGLSFKFAPIVSAATLMRKLTPTTILPPATTVPGICCGARILYIFIFLLV